ncbi:MAG: Holliday junction branch migration protein RuvA [Legionellales bacterium]|nr:Holliday junction branch migration protein RuvA [Legionellales bacterium]
MIGHLTGILISKQPPDLLMDVQGVGYEVAASMQTIYQLPELNETVHLYTQLIVREDAHLLYGFADLVERGLFRQLIKVNGIGPKLALTILSSMTASQLIHKVHTQDANSLVKVPGIGKKTAQRMLIELRDRLQDMPTSTVSDTSLSAPTMAVMQPEEEAMTALMALGYKAMEANRLIKAVAQPQLTTTELIRKALQEVG